MRVKKAVITAAGLGTRFLPATKVIPKPMLPVFDKPTIQYIMEEIKSAGIEKVAIIISPDGDIIKDYFSANPVLEENLLKTGKTTLYDIVMQIKSYNVEFIVQDVPNGLANAVYCAKDFVNNEPFALLMGDEIYLEDGIHQSCLNKLISEYLTTGVSQVNTVEVFGDDVSKYANLEVLDTPDGRLKIIDIKEKPSLEEAFSNYGGVGRYVLSPEIFKHIDETRPDGDEEVYLTDALRALALSEGLYACPFDDIRYDIGDKAGYVKANVDYALKDEKVGAEIYAYLKDKFKD